MWVSVEGELTPVPLRIPRQFYLHFKNPPRVELFRTEYYQLEKVARHLPRDIPCNNLYKVVVKEDVYEDIREHFTDLTNDPNVDGVFELQVGAASNAM